MNMPSISVLAILAAVTGIFAALLWFLCGQSWKIASTSQELLDLFEDKVRPARRKPHTDRTARTGQ
jgi:hypothetical protein